MGREEPREEVLVKDLDVFLLKTTPEGGRKVGLGGRQGREGGKEGGREGWGREGEKEGK